MGKNQVIKSLSNVIGNVLIHKILVKYTNKPESVSKLKHEVATYSETAAEIAEEFNWSENDKAKIKEESLKKFNREMNQYYPDVKFPIQDVEILLDETIDYLLEEQE